MHRCKWHRCPHDEVVLACVGLELLDSVLVADWRVALVIHSEVCMSIVTFLLLLVIAAIAAGAWVLIAGWNSRLFAAAFVAFALALTLPTLLTKLLGG